MPLRYPAERIVVKAPNWVGDVVAATGAMRCLRRNYPDARLALVVRPSVAPVLRGAPWFDQVILHDRHESSAADRRAAREALRQGQFDLGVLFTHSLSSRWLLWRAGVRQRVGLAKSRRALFLTDPVDLAAVRGDRRFVPKVEVYRALCERLGCADAGDQRPELFVGEDLRKRGDDLLRRHGAGLDRPLLGMVPGASYGPSKCWPAERFAAVGDRFVEELGFDVVLFTGPREGAIADAVARLMAHRAVRFPPDTTDLHVLKALVARCALMVCNDTGPRHYAIALGIPTVTLMGPTDPLVTESPYENGVVLRQEVPCAPCYRRRCPIDHACMAAISINHVFDAARSLLAGPGG